MPYKQMSRRKQLKPKPVKKDTSSAKDSASVLVESENEGDSTEPVNKKSRLTSPIDDNLSCQNDDNDCLEDEQRSASPESMMSSQQQSPQSSGDRLLNCQLCNSYFDSISGLQLHTLKEHLPNDISDATLPSQVTESGSMECQHCSAVFPHLAAFAQHMRQHLSDGIVSTGSTIGSSSAEPSSTGACCSDVLVTAPSTMPTANIGTASAMLAASAQAALLLELAPCPICSATFTDSLTRLSHLVLHYQVLIRRRACLECRAVFPSSSALIQHSTERHLKIHFVCTICSHSTDNQKDFNEHCLIHSQETVAFECNICQIGFDSREMLAVHIQFVHDRDGKLFEQHQMATAVAANLINSQSSVLSVTTNHQHSEKQPEKEIRILQCSVCDERCAGEDALDEHRLFSHCKIPRSDVCTECSEPMRTAEDFEKHTRIHARDMYMWCAVCRQSLRSESQLILHCRFHMAPAPPKTETPLSSPNTINDQQCEICSKVLVSRDQLLLHLLEHDSRKTCPYCSRSFPLAHHLLAHVSEDHSSEKSLYNCDICGESFQFSIQLEHHRICHGQDIDSSESSESGLFSCNQCEKSFQTISSLQSHAASHRNGALKRCPICCLSFNTASRYENHVRKHVNTSCCICQICGQGFSRRDELEQHMMVHKGNLEIGARSQQKVLQP